MILIILYKGLRVDVGLSDVDQTSSHGYSKDSVCIRFCGKDNWFSRAAERGGEFHDKLEAILRENGLESENNYDGNPYFSILEHKGMTTFSSPSKEAALHMMLATWQIIQENSNDVEFREKDYLPDSFLHLYGISRFDRNSFNDYLIAGYNSLSSPSRGLQNAFLRYQTSTADIKKELDKVKSSLINLSAKHEKMGYFRQIKNDFDHQINAIFENKICLTPLVKYEVAKVISETYQKVVVAHKKNSFFGKIGWSTSNFATDLSRKFKEYLLEDGVDNKALRAVKSANPIDICYGVAAYYFNLSRSIPKTPADEKLAKFKEQAKRYLKLAIDVDKEKNITELAKKIDIEDIIENAKMSEHIALHVIRTPELRENLTPQQLGGIIASITEWTEEKAIEVIDIIAGPPVLIDNFYRLNSLRSSCPSVNLTILSKPTLLGLSIIFIAYILYDAWDAVMKNIDSCEAVSEELLRFIKVARKNDKAVQWHNESRTDLRELSSRYAAVFNKLEEKALKGYIDFQLLVGQLYREENPFTSKNAEKASEFLLMAALKGNEEALVILLEMDAAETHDSIKYSLGKFYLDQLDYEKALGYLSQVTPTSKHYEDATFERGNIEFCISKDKAAALKLFTRISPEKHSVSALIAASSGSLGTNSAIGNIHSTQEEPTSDPAPIADQGAPKFPMTAWSFPDNPEDKKVSREQLEGVWKEYQRIKNNKFFKTKTSPETLAVYNKARSPIYNDVGRYRVLSEYALDKKNQNCEFYKLLVKEFGEDFFKAKLNHKPASPFFHSEPSEAGASKQTVSYRLSSTHRYYGYVETLIGKTREKLGVENSKDKGKGKAPLP